MKFKPTIAGEASGSIGALTFSHNRGGAYIRNRVIPVNPNTTFQQAIRGFCAQLTSAWLSTLTPAQRSAWDTYALNVPLPDSIGEPRNVGGLGMYVRSNVARLLGTDPRVDSGPTEFNLGEFTNPTIGSASAASQDVDVTFTNADEWANEADSAMYVFLSRGMNASRNYFKGPYRLAGVINGDAATPPTSPATISFPFTLAVGQKIFAKINVTRADGRYSSPFRLGDTVAA